MLHSFGEKSDLTETIKIYNRKPVFEASKYILCIKVTEVTVGGFVTFIHDNLAVTIVTKFTD